MHKTIRYYFCYILVGLSVVFLPNIVLANEHIISCLGPTIETNSSVRYYNDGNIEHSYSLKCLTKEKQTTYPIEIKGDKQSVTNEKGYTILICEYSYPQLVFPENDKNVKVLSNVNREIEEMIRTRYDKLCEEAKDYVKEFELQISNGDVASGLLPFQVSVKYYVSYNNNSYFSSIGEEYTWFGGAHPNTERKSINYNLDTGKQLEVTDLLNYSESEVKSYIAKEMLLKYKEHPRYYFKEEINKLQTLKYDYNFYLDYTGVVLYFNPYELGPYVTGIVLVDLPAEKNKEWYKNQAWFIAK